MKKLLLSTLFTLFAGTALQAADRFVSYSPGGMHLNAGGNVSVYVDPSDLKGVSIAARNLCTDINKVCGATATLGVNTSARIVAGTLGHSAVIDRLAKSGVIDAKALKGRTEKFIITTSDNQLIIAGSDRRGTIYGIYELSKQIGVSPWYYWADVPVARHNDLYINKGIYTDGEPAVRYRGIFMNDEAPCLVGIGINIHFIIVAASEAIFVGKVASVGIECPYHQGHASIEIFYRIVADEADHCHSDGGMGDSEASW